MPLNLAYSSRSSLEINLCGLLLVIHFRPGLPNPQSLEYKQIRKRFHVAVCVPRVFARMTATGLHRSVSCFHSSLFQPAHHSIPHPLSSTPSSRATAFPQPPSLRPNATPSSRATPPRQNPPHAPRNPIVRSKHASATNIPEAVRSRRLLLAGSVARAVLVAACSGSCWDCPSCGLHGSGCSHTRVDALHFRVYKSGRWYRLSRRRMRTPPNTLCSLKASARAADLEECVALKTKVSW